MAFSVLIDFSDPTIERKICDLAPKRPLTHPKSVRILDIKFQFSVLILQNTTEIFLTDRPKTRKNDEKRIPLDR